MPPLSFINRISGEISTEPPSENILLGMWQILTQEKGIFLNASPLKNNEYLIPEASGKFTLKFEKSHEEFLCSRNFIKSILPYEVDRIKSTISSNMDNIKIIQILGETLKENKPWEDWIKVVPIVQNFSGDLELTRLERLIQEKFGHLKSICTKPRSYLRTDIERLPISRARRFPSKAANYLASHTEDWEKPTLRSVLPKRILSEVREEELNIYENRVTIQLIDLMNFYLLRRITILSKLLNLCRNASNHSSSTKGTHWRQNRIYKIWGESENAGDLKIKAEETLKEVKRLYFLIKGLKDSPLYQEIYANASVSKNIHMTNILTNDPHYRYVPILWKEVTNETFQKARTPEQFYLSLQEFCVNFGYYCALLVFRALEQLGSTPQGKDIERPIKPGEKLRLKFYNEEKFDLEWKTDFSLCLSQSDKELLRIVPLPSDFSLASSSEIIEIVLEKISQEKNSYKKNILILYLSNPSEEKIRFPEQIRQKLHTIGNEQGSKEGLGLIPVSPWEIASVEYVTRAIRWYLTIDLFGSYPPEITAPVPEKIKLEEFNPWIQKGKNGNWHILREPSKDDCDKIKSRFEEIDDDLQKIVKEKERTQKEKQFSSFKEELLSGIEKIRKLLICPMSVCKTKITKMENFKSSQGDYFLCCCPECKTEWGIRTCTSCRNKIPTLLPNRENSAENIPQEEFMGWWDQIFGSDLLSIPIKKNQEISFLCSKCG